ncbi:type II secretion system protein J [Chloroflexota bacterium]
MKQKGFTLVELLVALGVGMIIMVGVVLGIQRVIISTDESTSDVVMLADLNNAVIVIKKDLMVTQDTDLIDGNPVPQSSASFTWTDYTSFGSENVSRYHSCNYTLSGTFLQRNYNGITSVVGRNITYIGFTLNGRVISVNITGTGTGVSQPSETFQFSTYIRAEAIQ